MKRKWKNYTTRKGMEKKRKKNEEDEDEKKKALLFPKIAVHKREVFTHYRKWTSKKAKKKQQHSVGTKETH